MSEDLSRRNDVKINYQFWILKWRIILKDINNRNDIIKAIIKRIIQFQKLDKGTDWKSIPIVINNFNRVSFLKKQIEDLKNRGYNNVYVIDNSSTYKPLLDYLKSEKIKVFYLDDNVGFLSIWKTIIYEYFKDGYYVYTDSDVIPAAECPDDFIDHFRKLLDKYPEVDKVGFALKINDIPDEFSLKEQVQQHEKQFWEKEVEKDVYEAMIDTTFALYRPKKKGGYWLRSLRTGGNFIALHLPWYSNSKNLSAEDKYYNKNVKTSTHWSQLNNKEEI